MNELVASGIVKRFSMGSRLIEVLRGVDLSVRAGESIAIQGVSGVGKSTLLYILGGLEHPTEGHVRYDDRDLYAMEGQEIARIGRTGNASTDHCHFEIRRRDVPVDPMPYLQTSERSR